MKRTCWLMFIAAAAVCAPLFGQYEDSVVNASRIANVKVWVAPVKGGTEEEREYFDFNMPEEVRGSGYLLADSREESDFYILFTLKHDEEYGDEVITAELYATKTDALIITNTMGYKAVEEMNDWNLTMIYQLMANAPLHKYITTLEREVGTIPRKPALGFPEYWLYLGFRGGYSIRQYQILADKDLQIENMVWGHSFEAGIQVSVQPLRFLSVQAEALFTNDAVPFRYGEILDTASRPVSITKDAYDSYSILVPLTLKGTFHLYDRLALNPFGGVYFMAPLGTINGFKKEDPTISKGGQLEYKGGSTPAVERIESNYTYTLPLGWTAGLEIGMVLGKERNRGTIFLDLRYSADLGDLVREDGTPVYKRAGMASITAGYRFGFLKRGGRQAPVQENIPEDFGSNGLYDEYDEQFW